MRSEAVVEGGDKLYELDGTVTPAGATKWPSARSFADANRKRPKTSNCSSRRYSQSSFPDFYVRQVGDGVASLAKLTGLDYSWRVRWIADTLIKDQVPTPNTPRYSRMNRHLKSAVQYYTIGMVRTSNIHPTPGIRTTGHDVITVEDGRAIRERECILKSRGEPG